MDNNLDLLLKTLTDKKNRLDSFRPLPPELVKNLKDWFRVELTYTSNAIEGNTLTRQETALVIEKGLTVEGKPLKDHLEATNHAEALDYLKNLVNKKHTEISENDILDIHKLVLQKIDQDNAGRYRTVPVRIAGSEVIMPNPLKVPDLMHELISWLKSAVGHPATLAADIHFKLVSIHPFVDGNGRTARLLMNLVLLQTGYTPAIVSNQIRSRYINAIEQAQLGGSLDDYYQIIYQAIDKSLNIYLEAVDTKHTPS